VCGDYLVVPAVLIRDTVQGGIYIVLERGFRKAHVVYITSPHRLLGALQKREVLVGLWKLCGGLRREDPEPGREIWRYRHRKRSDWEWERRFGKVLFAALTETCHGLGRFGSHMPNSSSIIEVVVECRRAGTGSTLFGV